MGYIRKRQRRPKSGAVMTALGDLASTITAAANAIGIATDLAADPYLPETVCRVGQVREVNAGRKPGACVKTADGLRGGVGLRKLIKPLRGYSYAEQHPWAYAAAVAGVIGVPMLIGYALAKGGGH